MLPSPRRFPRAIAASIAVLVVFLLGAIGLYSYRYSDRTLAAVYAQNVLPSMALSRIDTTLKDARFRLAGVLLKQISTAGSINQANEARDIRSYGATTRKSLGSVTMTAIPVPCWRRSIGICRLSIDFSNVWWLRTVPRMHRTSMPCSKTNGPPYSLAS